MKPYSTLKLATLGLSLSLLAACSSKPQQFIFSPNYTLSHQNVVQKDIALSVNDRRASFTTVTIKNSDGTQALADKYVSNAITPAIKTALEQIGASNSSIGKALDINILLLQSTIKQQLHKHSVSSAAELEVVVEDTEHRFTKRYKGNQQSEAPLSYDKANVEKQVNRLIEDIIARIVTDPEFINALNQ